MNKKYTLITGAAGGLGSAFAISCARLGMNLILITLPGSSIRRTANELQNTYHVDVKVFEFDLTNEAAFKQNISFIKQRFSINFLINNAGMGGTMSIIDAPTAIMDRIIQLNIRSMVLLTKELLPVLFQQKKSYILNIASMAACTPIAYKTVYPASKSFVSSFSIGLRQELRKTNISVSVAYPGPIMTNSNTSQRILSQGVKARMGLCSTLHLANHMIQQTMAGQAKIVTGWWNRLQYNMLRIIPEQLKVQLVSNTIKRELNEVI